MIPDYTKQFVLRRYFNAIIPTLGVHRITQEYYNFRCNICGDSKKSKTKKRGYLLLYKGKWLFKCHNCNVSMGAEKWFKEYFPVRYKQYIKDLLSMSSNKKKTDMILTEDKEKQLKEMNKAFMEKAKKEKKAISFFVPMTKTEEPLVQKAIEFCITRRIPNELWQDWFVSTDDVYHHRMIIPFYDDKQKIYYYQARTLIGNDTKYLNREKNKENGIYNYYHINRNKIVMITEGPIDSMFINNCIAILGTNPPKEVLEQLSKLKCCYIFDSDEAGRKASIKYLKKGQYVFNWKKFIKENRLPDREKWDMNDVYLYMNRESKFTFKELKNCFTRNIYDRIYFV